MSHRLDYVSETNNRFTMHCDCCGAEHSELVHKSSTDMDVHSSIIAARLRWFYHWGRQQHICCQCLGKQLARDI